MNRGETLLVIIEQVRTSWFVQVIGSGIYRENGG